MSHVVVIVFEKLTLLGAFSDYFLKEGGGEGPPPLPLTAYAPPYHTRLAFLPDLLVCF